MLNPSYQRKQLIRSSINLRRSVPYDDTPNVHNVILGYTPASQTRSDELASRLAPGSEISNESNEHKVNAYPNARPGEGDRTYHPSHSPTQGLRPHTNEINMISSVQPYQPAIQPTHSPTFSQPSHPSLITSQTQYRQAPQQIPHPQLSVQTQPPSHSSQPHRPIQPPPLSPHHLAISDPRHSHHSPLRVTNSIDLPRLSSDTSTPHSPRPVSPIPPPTTVAFTPLTTERIGSTLFPDTLWLGDDQSSFAPSNTTSAVTKTSITTTTTTSPSSPSTPFPARALFNCKPNVDVVLKKRPNMIIRGWGWGRGIHNTPVPSSWIEQKRTDSLSHPQMRFQFVRPMFQIKPQSLIQER